MAAYNFPNSPSDGDTVTVNGITYSYSSSKSRWQSIDNRVHRFSVSETAPTSPSVGDFWFDPNSLRTYVYYNDGSSNQWVQANPTGLPTDTESGVQTYATIAIRDGASVDAGTLGFVTANTTLYLYDGSQWEKVASGVDESPVIITEPPTELQYLNFDGTTSTVTMTAQDPEGFSITYGIAYNTSDGSRPSQLASDTQINQSTGVYTFTPSTTVSNEGTFKARLSASDGVHSTTRLVNLDLSFFDGNYLYAGDGTAIKSYSGASRTVDSTAVPDTVSDASTLYDVGRIDAAQEWILFSGLPDWDVAPTSSDGILMLGIQINSKASASQGMGFIDKDGSRFTISSTGGSIGIGVSNGTGAPGGPRVLDTELSNDVWYILAFENVNDFTNLSIRAKQVGSSYSPFTLAATGSTISYTQTYIDNAANNRALFFGTFSDHADGYTSRAVLDHKIAALGVANASTNVDTLISQFEDKVFQ
tara:strand:- start:537 stop:1961 length:1425 start_codon:yes stop_codon:yes gene_type:complete